VSPDPQPPRAVSTGNATARLLVPLFVANGEAAVGGDLLPVWDSPAPSRGACRCDASLRRSSPSNRPTLFADRPAALFRRRSALRQARSDRSAWRSLLRSPIGDSAETKLRRHSGYFILRPWKKPCWSCSALCWRRHPVPTCSGRPLACACVVSLAISRWSPGPLLAAVLGRYCGHMLGHMKRSLFEGSRSSRTIEESAIAARQAL
jgi:hypothetical protein